MGFAKFFSLVWGKPCKFGPQVGSLKIEHRLQARIFSLLFTNRGVNLFSQTAEYALRAVIWLAEHQDEGSVGNKRIAEDTDVPASYLSKILHDLASAGFLSSRRGVGGGFRLIVSPDELSMLDVVNAVDPLRRIRSCSHGNRTPFDPMCRLHQKLDEAIGMVEKTLRTTSIREMAQESLATAVFPSSEIEVDAASVEATT